MITYILIGLILYALTIILMLLLFTGASYYTSRNNERPQEKHINETQNNRVDAEIAYMESLYGVDDHVRSRRESN